MSIRNPVRAFANDDPARDSESLSEKISNCRHCFTVAGDLIGQRVQIRAIKEFGSARLLNGLTGTVVGMHPIASGWVKLNLDDNPITPFHDWSVAIDRLVLLETEARAVV